MAPQTKLVIESNEIGFLYALPAIRYLQLKFPEFTGTEEVRLTTKRFAHILYAGHQCYCDAEDIAETYTYRQFYDMVDEQITKGEISEDFIRVAGLLGKSTKVETAGTVDEKKSPKKSIGKRSKSSA